MRPDVPEPDYLPEGARAWAREYRDLLELIVDDLLATGSWPSVKTLTRRLAREQRPVALSAVLWQMPKPLGFVESYPDRVVLLLFGLRMTHAGHKLLAGFFALRVSPLSATAGPTNSRCSPARTQHAAPLPTTLTSARSAR